MILLWEGEVGSSEAGPKSGRCSKKLIDGKIKVSPESKAPEVRNGTGVVV